MSTSAMSVTNRTKYSKPLTGNYEVDVVQSRDKRIFNDEKGKRAAANTDPFLLQTYSHGSRRGGERPVDAGDRPRKALGSPPGRDPAGSHAEGLTDPCGSG